MNYLFLLNGIFCCLFFLFFLKNYFSYFGNSVKRKKANVFLGIAFIYFIYSLLFFLWFFKIFTYSLSDFLILYAIGLLVQTILFFRICYFYSRNWIFYIFILGYLVFISLFLVMGINFFLKYFFILSFIIMGFFFLQVLFFGDAYKRIAIVGILYSFISVLFYVLFLLDIGNILAYFLGSVVILFIFLYFFFLDIELYGVAKKSIKGNYFSFLSNLLFVILLINFVFIGTIAFHEFGHYAISGMYDCEYRQIVFQGDFFRTELFCSNLDDVLPAVLGGVLLPYIIALLLLVVGGRFLREIGILMIGFNSISVSSDFGRLGLSSNLVFVSVVIGGIFIVWGILSFIKSKIDISHNLEAFSDDK